MIASHIGYETYQKWIEITSRDDHFLNIQLKPRPFLTDTVAVIGQRRFKQELESDVMSIGVLEMNIAPKLGEPDLFRVIETYPGVTTVNGDYIFGAATPTRT